MTTVTVLDYTDGLVYQYEVDVNEQVFQQGLELKPIEAMLEEQGHRLKDIEYMIHADDTINKIKIEL